MEVDADEQELDGKYVILDLRHTMCIQSGCAEIGMKRRWREHESCSKMSIISSRKSVLYMSYPHTDTPAHNVSETMCRGNFQYLEQMVGVGFVRDKAEILLQPFELDISTRENVEQLNGIVDRTDFTDKWYRHLCYFCNILIVSFLMQEQISLVTRDLSVN